LFRERRTSSAPPEMCPRDIMGTSPQRLRTSGRRNSTRLVSLLSVDRCDACAWPILETHGIRVAGAKRHADPRAPASVWRDLTAKLQRDDLPDLLRGELR